MPTQQGDLSLLQDPVAQKLLQSTIPARLAYVWRDGTPRIVPIWFHWTGAEFVLGTPPDAPKVKVLKDGTRVALSIDSDTFPYKVLQVRGKVRVETIEGVAPEYAATARRTFGEEGGAAWVNQMKQLSSRMTRIVVRPDWVAILDFETRFPSAIERGMARAKAGG
jgi:hypothetical protein